MMTSVKLNKNWTETQQEQVLRRDEPKRNISVDNMCGED